MTVTNDLLELACEKYRDAEIAHAKRPSLRVVLPWAACEEEERERVRELLRPVVALLVERVEEAVYEEGQGALHRELDRLGIPKAVFVADERVRDGSTARLRNYVEDVRAKIGELDAVPRSRYEELRQIRSGLSGLDFKKIRAEIRAEEREACAKICDDYAANQVGGVAPHVYLVLADEIRSRRET